MARRKKLLSSDLLDKGVELLDMGVSMSRVHRTLGLDKHWSRQSTADLLMADRAGLHSVTRPAWLKPSTDVEGSCLQDTPAGWSFEGTFPYGEWVDHNLIVS